MENSHGMYVSLVLLKRFQMVLFMLLEDESLPASSTVVVSLSWVLSIVNGSGERGSIGPGWCNGLQEC